MDSIAVGFWGAFFGTAGLLQAAALLAFTRSARRVALTGSIAVLMSAAYVLVYLGWVPLQDKQELMRLQAHAAALCAAVLGMLLFRLLGLLRDRQRAVRSTVAMAALTVTVLGTGWLLPAVGALALGAAMEALIIPLAFVGAVRSAMRGTRPGWLAVAGVGFMSIAVVALTWSAFHPNDTPWPVHALSALAAIGYATSMACAMWVRYAYLLDVREAMVHGPGFDPITRMRSDFETDLMVVDAFARRGDGRSFGVIVVSIGNLQALEHLHGRAAFNHGLFICASRLRRFVPAGIEMGRLGDDAFLLLVRRPAGAKALIDLSHQVARRLARPVVLGTSQDMAALETSRATWVADVGVGVLVARPSTAARQAVDAARAMSRTAWSYSSRVAAFDEEAQQIVELPVAFA